MNEANQQPNIPRQMNTLPGLVYFVLLVIAFIFALLVFGNEAGWWRIDL